MPLIRRISVAKPESILPPTLDLESRLKEGVEDAVEAREIIAQLRDRGQNPKITMRKEFLEEVFKRGGLSEKETWIPGFRAIIGTLGGQAYVGAEGEERIVFEVINPAIRVEPRFTGRDKKFHGVVYFPQGFISLKDLSWQSN